MGLLEKASRWINKVFRRDTFSKKGFSRTPSPAARIPLAIDDLAGEIDVQRLRGTFGLTRTQFARRFGFSVATLRHWERGDRQPTGAALILLKVLEEEPRAVTRTLTRLHAARYDAALPMRDWP